MMMHGPANVKFIHQCFQISLRTEDMFENTIRVDVSALYTGTEESAVAEDTVHLL
jgi:hypothetical protein